MDYRNGTDFDIYAQNVNADGSLGGPQKTPTSAPTPTPMSVDGCVATGVKIWMPSHEFHPRDVCSCKVTVCNMLGYDLQDFPLFIILDVYGMYFFAPSFKEFDKYLDEYPEFNTGATEVTVIPEFTWSDVGNASGITWYAEMTDPEITQIFREMDTWIFGWTE